MATLFWRLLIASDSSLLLILLQPPKSVCVYLSPKNYDFLGEEETIKYGAVFENQLHSVDYLR
jgi:hypothetical protein